MKDLIKGLGTWILAILIIIILGIIILLLRCFVFDKIGFWFNKNFNKNKSQTTSNIQKVGDGASSFVNGVVSGYKETDVTNKDYNAYNFDDAILLYEGEQTKSGVEVVLNKLIENANGEFFSRPSVETRNFESQNKEVVYTNKEAYKTELQDIKNSLSEENYEISFGYNFLHTAVNKIIITKK